MVPLFAFALYSTSRRYYYGSVNKISYLLMLALQKKAVLKCGY